MQTLELRTYFGKQLLDVAHIQDPAKANSPFIVHEGGELKLRTEGAEGMVSQAGKHRALKLLGGRDVILDEGTHAVVQKDGLSVALRFVSPPDRIEGKAWDIDYLFTNVLAVVFMCMSVALFCLHLYPYDADAMEELMLNPRVATLMKEAPKPPEQEKRAQELLQRLEEKSVARSGGGARAPKSAKPAGKPGPMKISEKAIAEMPLFQAMKKGGLFAKVLGDGGALGDATIAALGDVGKNPVADRGDGLAARGDPNAPKGDPLSIGHERGDPLGRRPTDYGTPQLLPKREEQGPAFDPGDPKVTGMPPELIRAVIHENRNAFRYCYERALQAHHDLQGVAKVQFVIGPAGTVLSAAIKDSTLGDESVDQCLLTRMRALQFPKPPGGGVVIVNYPFVFRSAS